MRLSYSTENHCCLKHRGDMVNRARGGRPAPSLHPLPLSTLLRPRRPRSGWSWPRPFSRPVPSLPPLLSRHRRCEPPRAARAVSAAAVLLYPRAWKASRGATTLRRRCALGGYRAAPAGGWRHGGALRLLSAAQHKEAAGCSGPAVAAPLGPDLGPSGLIWVGVGRPVRHAA